MLLLNGINTEGKDQGNPSSINGSIKEAVIHFSFSRLPILESLDIFLRMAQFEGENL